MKDQIIKRHTTLYINNIQPIQFCGKTFYQINLNGAFELPFDIQPTTGEHDFNKCEKCTETLAELAKRLTDKFEGKGKDKGFPFCCSYHSNLVKIKEFDRSLFANVPIMVAKKIIYTTQHIINNHSSEKWYKIITDYIEYAVESFGQMPKDCGEPLNLTAYLDYVTDLLQRNTGVPKEKKSQLLKFLNAYQTPNKNINTDLNILLSTYQKWLQLFPFELKSYFGNLKEYFEKNIPLLNGKPEKNIYTGLVKGKLHTKTSLIEALINLTNTILTQVNGVTLYEMGLITDANKIKLELVNNTRKLRLKQGYKNVSSNDEKEYKRILDEWFNDEKAYFKELTQIVEQTRKSPEKMTVEGNNTLNFLPIDESSLTHLPFEIKLIYNRNYTKDVGQRFIKVEGKNYLFFTEIDNYYIFCEHFKSGELYTDNLQPLSFENVREYYKAYAEGFLKGYRGFDEKVKSSTAIFQTDMQSIVKKVFEYINTPIAGLASYGVGWLNRKHVNIIKKNIWLEAGIKTGEKYKAWFFVINNYSYFIDLFRTHEIYINLYHSAAKYWKEKRGGEGMYQRTVNLLAEIGETERKANEEKIPQISKPTLAAYAIMHVYLSMFSGQAVTQQNKNQLAKKYGYNSGEQLRNDFTKYKNEDKRLDLNTTNRRAANTHLERFRTILPLLKNENTEAFEKAKQDLQKLENLYNKHY